MFFISFFFIMLSSLFSSTVCSQSLQNIDALIAKELPHANVSIYIKSALTGKIIYSRQADTLLTPASSTKLFTAAAALYYFPKDYRFTTSIAQGGDNVYLNFSGAPDFTTENLLQLLEALQKLNEPVISGDIVLDISRFKEPYFTPGSSYEDLGWYYAAPETALVLNENAVSYDFISAKELGMPIKIKPIDPHNRVKIIHDVLTVDAETAKTHCSLSVESLSNNTLRLSGCLALSKEPVTMHLSVPDPVLLATEIIRDYLNKHHIDLRGNIIIGKTPPNVKTLAHIESKDISKLVTHMLQHSDNLYASCLTRSLGYAITGEGSIQQGVFAIKKILSEHTHLDVAQLNLADGVGTRYNLITAKQIVTLLSDLYQEKQSAFPNMLAQPGLAGTLQNRMQNNALHKVVFAKTGTMHDVSSLSGYILQPHADVLIFSIIINGITAINDAKDLEDHVLLMILKSIIVPERNGYLEADASLGKS